MVNIPIITVARVLIFHVDYTNRYNSRITYQIFYYFLFANCTCTARETNFKLNDPALTLLRATDIKVHTPTNF